MDPETGEDYPDTETGETPSKLNAETGECENGAYILLGKFKIPSSLYAIKQDEKIVAYEPLKADKHKLELITAVIFLLPTMIFFSPILWIFVILFEISLHNWSHKINKRLKSRAIYFRSPLHVMVKEFCGRCKEENAIDKITKIQDIRNDRLKKYGLEYIRKVVT